MVDKNTKVMVIGFGDMDYPNNPTFQEVTTLEKSFKIIEDYLKTQNKYHKNGYDFSINTLENSDFVYSYLNGKIRISKKYKNLGLAIENLLT